MSLIIHRTCLLLLACVAFSHAPLRSPLQKKRSGGFCQRVSIMVCYVGRRCAEVSTDIAGKTYRVMPLVRA